MKKLIGVLAFTLVAASTQVSAANIQFVGKNTSKETNLCLLAAQQGYQAVVKQSGDKILAANTKCNGIALKTFAASFVQAEDKIAEKTVVLPANQSLESQLCVKAVKQGLNAVGHRAYSLKCNGQPVAHFVKSIKRS